MLDTDTCIFIIRQRPPKVAARMADLAPDDICLSIVTFAELMTGANKSQRVEHNLSVLADLAGAVQIVPFGRPAAEAYGRIRSDLEARGTPIGSNDLFIAAHALSQSDTLVTNNIREFGRVEGLALDNWI